MTEKNELEPDEVASLSSKAKWLEKELNILGQSIGSRSQVLQTYVAFLKSSEEVQLPVCSPWSTRWPLPSSYILWGWEPWWVVPYSPPRCMYSLIGPWFTKAPYKTKAASCFTKTQYKYVCVDTHTNKQRGCVRILFTLAHTHLHYPKYSTKLFKNKSSSNPWWERYREVFVFWIFIAKNIPPWFLVQFLLPWPTLAPGSVGLGLKP